VDFKQPDAIIDEGSLAIQLAQPINADTFSSLLTGNFLLVMDAYDHRCERQHFQDIVVNAFNLQNRLVRFAEIKGLEEQAEMPGFGAADLKSDGARHLASAMEYKRLAQRTLALLREMRKPEDSVS
jgi:hypothetical protein